MYVGFLQITGSLPVGHVFTHTPNFSNSLTLFTEGSAFLAASKSIVGK
jgi:hypothetical protein